MSLENQLPEEPAAACAEPVALLRIRCPDGRVLNRRFLAAEPLAVLLTYVGSVGFEPDTYKLLTTYPRKDVSMLVLVRFSCYFRIWLVQFSSVQFMTGQGSCCCPVDLGRYLAGYSM